jgi:hypothetical protein
MQAISLGAGIVLWAWIGPARYSQRGDVDILHYRWSVPIYATFRFKPCRLMASGLLPR